MGLHLSVNQAVARSLKVTRTTYLVVAATTAAVVTNATVAMGAMGLSGQMILLALTFVFVASAASAVSTDILSRSSQTIANLRSIGATRRSIFGGVLLAFIGWGLAGAVLGAGLGSAIGVALTSPSGAGLPYYGSAVFALVVAGGATASGVYFGVGMAWRS
jgi:cell division protein FtsX